MKLHTDYYSQVHKWKTMAFAVREWLLREYYSDITEDLKFLIKKWIHVVLYHNLPKNTWNDKFLQEKVSSKIPWAHIERVGTNIDFYEYIVSVKQDIDKLIILERQYLIWEKGDKINTISTNKLQTELAENNAEWLWIANVNIRRALLKICQAVENSHIHRVHILPWGRKNAIKHELFSLEWVWTLIWNDFWNPEIRNAWEQDEHIIKWILESHKKNKFLKPRSKEYISRHISQFKIAYIDGIPVGCMEIIQEDEKTIELWALTVIHSFLSLKIWVALIQYIQSYARKYGFGIISLTNNEKLQGIYVKFWFEKYNDSPWFEERKKRSPWVSLFYMTHEKLVENLSKMN